MKTLIYQIGALTVRQWFDRESNTWLTLVSDANGVQVGEMEYCSYGDKEGRRTGLNKCKKAARDLQGISGLKVAKS